jgi:multicomponent Na+:H+ antiporter subunit G
MRELLGNLVILAGAVFLFSAGLGLLRMPDVYTRIQAGTKATTLGNVLVLAGVAIHHPGWTWRLALVIGFVLLSNPVSSHALSRAAWSWRTPMAPATVVDALANERGHDGRGGGA